MEAKLPTWDELVKGLTSYRVTTAPVQTRDEQDDQTTIFGVKNYVEVAREIAKRKAQASAPAKTTRFK